MAKTQWSFACSEHTMVKSDSNILLSKQISADNVEKKWFYYIHVHFCFDKHKHCCLATITQILC